MGRAGFASIEAERILLRRFKESDAEAFFSIRTDPRVALYQGEGWVKYKPEQALGFVREQMHSEPGIPGMWFQVAIELKETGELIGDCAIHTLPQDAKQAEIGFTLAPAFQNKGFAAEAVRCLLGYIFGALEMHRAIAVTDVRNIKSIKLIERIGMRREGHFIQNAWNKGEYTDEYLYAILKEEWEAKIR